MIKSKEKEYVFVVAVDWRVDEFESGYDITLFRDFHKADGFFHQLIEKECVPENSWVGDQALDSDGNPVDGYVKDFSFSESADEYQFWDVTETEGLRYTYISLKRMEVQ